MADMRVILENHQTEYDLMCTEVSKGSPTEAKMYHDHCKLMIETKDIFDNSPVTVHYIPSIQFCGHELFIYSLSHHADNLYVAKKSSYAFVPPTIVNLDFCDKICQILLGLKNEWVTYKQIIENKLNEKKKKYAFNSQEPEDGPRYTWTHPIYKTMVTCPQLPL
ncbi:hypothetical protein HPULCUR_008477 [Helicostylum pulchrum]|uniref:Uncharacterized protein n=1 Tax=Helicostylum pulchrum TaxID=562976 RepID=A0ABP9Y9N0_9FUNG